MSDLSSIMQRAQSDLQKVHSQVKNASLGTSKIKIQTHLLVRTVLHEDLLETKRLFECREDAMKCLEGLRDNVIMLGSASLSTKIQFGTANITISSARLQSVDSYLAVTWSIYDRLSNVLGRLMGDTKTGENSNPARNLKLVENLISPTKGFCQGFGINELLPKLYAEPIFASYFLRNSFMHDGGMMGNVPILSGNSAAASFELSKENAEKMNDIVTKRLNDCLGQEYQCNDLFQEGDFVCQLKACHDDLDKMFAAWVEFAVGSFCRQFYLFCEKIGINPVADVELGLGGEA